MDAYTIHDKSKRQRQRSRRGSMGSEICRYLEGTRLSCLGALTVRLDLLEAPVESTRPRFCFGFVLFVSSSTRFRSFYSLFISSPAIPRD